MTAARLRFYPLHEREAALQRLENPRVGHRLRLDGRVEIRVPKDGVVSDEDARRLAWGLLSDLAPEDVVAVPQVVSHREGQRLIILRAVAGGAMRTAQLVAATGWKERQVQRRVAELLDDGRLVQVSGQRGRRVPLNVALAEELPE